ncbi:3-isopropylmalate dehydratase large subunit [Paracoccus sp. (in: a-proteobacteria)]|uniref:3-isopropylmalate dehydratase large subunit n=1 Tax=Paracoccus sp. TaxID=267 RepID=UPI003A856E34
MLDKIWTRHEILTAENGASLLWVDRHLVHEGSHHAFRKLAGRALPVARPDLTFAVVDHYAPTRGRDRLAGTVQGRMIDTLRDNAGRHGLRLFDLNDPRQGIVHVIGPEQGLTLPGLLINCGDSHTSTHGAFGALAFGIGATEVAHVLATQTIWQDRPKTMRITIDGRPGPGVGAKDFALGWIARLGADGARGHAVEYAGAAVRALSMEGRMTLCNLTIEGGGRLGMVAPDDRTLAYLKGRPHAPQADWSRLADKWLSLASDRDAQFNTEFTLDATSLAPVVTWGTSPEDALPIDATIPDPARAAPGKADHIRDALDYMGLTPGCPLQGIPVDQVFIGSCTNARIEDLRAAAAILAGRKARIRGMVSPGSGLVRAQAEDEGLDRLFREAGLDWVAPGCSMCVAMNGDSAPPGSRVASTTNRNFKGRQGRGVRTHLMSPAMAAAAAITGTLTDMRPFLQGRHP